MRAQLARRAPRRSAARGAGFFGSLWSLALLACVPPPEAPPATVDLPSLFAIAFRESAIGDADDAIERQLDTLRAAAREERDPWQLAAVEASVEALATRRMPALGDASRDAALAHRTGRGAVIRRELELVARRAKGAFARGIVARGLESLAEHAGDEVEAERWRVASGCVREALVVGPLSWAPVSGIGEPGPFDHAGARVEASYPTGSPFGAALHPVAVGGGGCALALSAESARPGVREVVVDVEVPRAQRIGVALRAHGAAELRAAGVVVAERPFELGDGEAVRFARVAVTAGVLRLTARVGTAKEDDRIELDVWGEDGAPLRAGAPAVGSVAPGRVLSARPVAEPSPVRDDEKLLASASALASGNAHLAERILWPAAARAEARPDLALCYGRAVDRARDLSPATRAERARSAYERVLEAWPESWEATVAHSVLAGVRRGRGEAGLEVLRDLDALAGHRPKASPVVDVFDAITSAHEHVLDRARAALERAQPVLGGTAMWADAEALIESPAGADLVALACDAARKTAKDGVECWDALRAVGDRPRAAAELARLRRLLGAPRALASQEMTDALAAGDRLAARRAYAALLPAERTITSMALLDASAGRPREFLDAAVQARDAPGALGPWLRAMGDDPTHEFSGVAERLAAEDHAAPILPSAATAVLDHVERYEVSSSGLVRWVLFDVRRVSGTTDVEENAQAAGPDIWGRNATRPLERRIFKRDGRVLEPDPAPRASQGHADLPQLEQGDIVEALYEGWSLPGDTGDIGIDTPDLLPDRTAVHAATIELRLPRGLSGSLWSHPVLGKADERTDGDMRVVSWSMADVLSRRVEDGVPKMDRSADVSFSTATWGGVARALRETIASLGEHDPEIAAWAHEATRAVASGSQRAAVEAMVAAAGVSVREADPGTLSDYGGGIASAQARTARTFLTSGDGSRSWVIVRGLRELSIPCEVVVAENEPFSADPTFPPHFGRFSHPLVVAQVDGQPMWIDADVQGPPLPAGRVSPELRGRLTLHTDGTIAALPAVGGDDGRNEVDVRLVLDDKGDARGTFAIVLRGRDAQDLSEAFLRIVGAERQRALRDVVLSWLPWANVDRVELASSEGSWQVGLRADVNVSGYAQPESRKVWLLPGLDTMHWSSPRARVSGLGPTFAVRARRESALALSSAVQYHLHRRLELPTGAVVARMPGPLAVRSKLVEASRSIAIAGGGHVIEDDFVLGVATGTVSPADYDAFVAVAHAVDDGFLASTRVAPPIAETLPPGREGRPGPHAKNLSSTR